MWYAPIEPYDRGFLETGDGHFVYWEASGNPAGVLVLVLHGGPGGATTPNSRRWFDPRRYRIIVFDQRGCGRSTPHACISANTTRHLLADIEALRHRLGVDRWMLWGKSWGSTLALAYAEAHPDCVSRLVLSGVFTAQQSELDWLYRGGAARVFPAAWDQFRLAPPAAGSADAIAAYHDVLTCGDAEVERKAARSWCEWEQTLSTAGTIPLQDDDATVVARARLQAHYFVNNAFLVERQLIADADRLTEIPGTVVQGVDDYVTPPATARELCDAWPSASLRLIPGAGHRVTDHDMMRALIDAFDE